MRTWKVTLQHEPPEQVTSQRMDVTKSGALIFTNAKVLVGETSTPVIVRAFGKTTWRDVKLVQEDVQDSSQDSSSDGEANQ